MVVPYILEDKCSYCNRAYTNKLLKTYDHILPISRTKQSTTSGAARSFGITKMPNLIDACIRCNQWKRSYHIQHWMQILLYDKNTVMYHYYEDLGLRNIVVDNIKIILNTEPLNIPYIIGNLKTELDHEQNR